MKKKMESWKPEGELCPNCESKLEIDDITGYKICPECDFIADD